MRYLSDEIEEPECTTVFRPDPNWGSFSLHTPYSRHTVRVEAERSNFKIPEMPKSWGILTPIEGTVARVVDEEEEPPVRRTPPVRQTVRQPVRQPVRNAQIRNPHEDRLWWLQLATDAVRATKCEMGASWLLPTGCFVGVQYHGRDMGIVFTYSNLEELMVEILTVPEAVAALEDVAC